MALLDRTYLAFRIEHIDVNTLDTEETVCYCRTGITRGGHKDVHLFFLSLHADEILQQSGHKPGTYILKGEGRAVEEFQRIDIVLDLLDRTVERECVIDDVLEGIEVYILSEEGTGHVVGDLLERHLVDVVEENLRQYLDLFW